MEKITFKPSKLKFLSGLGYAIYVAAFSLDEDEAEEGDGTQAIELDSKAFLPRPLASSGSLEGLGEVNEKGLGVWLRKPSMDFGTTTGSPIRGQRKVLGTVGLVDGTVSLAADFEQMFMPPTWEPSHEFSYPVARIAVAYTSPDDLTLQSFSNIKHIADGSNANVFLANFQGEQVIIKMIKEDVQYDSVAVHEFDVEHGIFLSIYTTVRLSRAIYNMYFLSFTRNKNRHSM